MSSSALRLAITSTASLPTGFSFTGIFWNMLLHWQNSPSSITTISTKYSTYLLLCCCSVAQLCPTLCDIMNCSTPAFPVLHHLPELAQTHIHWVGDAIQPSHPLSSPYPLALNLSQHQGLFQWVSSLHREAKVLEFFSFSISPSNEYSGLISSGMDWLYLLAVQGTFKSLLQHHSSKASIHWHSAFFMVLLSYLYMTTGKTIAKSLQLCPTLCDPIDGSPPVSPVPGILQTRTLEWVAISFSNAWKWKVKGKSLSRVRLLATPWTAAYQAPPSMGFSRQEYWSGVPYW